jgi:hypothetical protein
MNEGIRWVIVGALLTLAVGCAGPTSAIQLGYADDESEPDVILGTMENRIVQLTTNIERLGKQIAALTQAPDTTNPVLRELRALDLAGWQLHQQQWILQRAHLLFTKEQLRRALETPPDKPQLLAQWTKQEQQYQTALEDLRQQRYALEQKYFQSEAQMIEQYLR